MYAYRAEENALCILLNQAHFILAKILKCVTMTLGDAI